MNSRFLEENPAISALLEVVSVPISDIFAQNAKMNAGEAAPEDVERHASEWIDAKADLVESWLERARAAAD